MPTTCSIQAPLKDLYRQSPEARWSRCNTRPACRRGELQDRNGQGARDGRPASGHGGSGFGACSGDMLLEALVACPASRSTRSRRRSASLRDALLRAEGDLDFRGTLGVSKDAPVGFQGIRLSFTLDTDASDEQLGTLRLTERYCVVYQTLVRPPTMTVARQIVEAERG